MVETNGFLRIKSRQKREKAARYQNASILKDSHFERFFSTGYG